MVKLDVTMLDQPVLDGYIECGVGTETVEEFLDSLKDHKEKLIRINSATINGKELDIKELLKVLKL